MVQTIWMDVKKKKKKGLVTSKGYSCDPFRWVIRWPHYNMCKVWDVHGIISHALCEVQGSMKWQNCPYITWTMSLHFSLSNRKEGFHQFVEIVTPIYGHCDSHRLNLDPNMPFCGYDLLNYIILLNQFTIMLFSKRLSWMNYHADLQFETLQTTKKD